jgi:hypothetical protein
MENKEYVERWHSDAFKSKELAYQIFDDVKNKLKIIPHPFTGWRSSPNQKFRTISINKNGLRNKDIKKLNQNSKNCFLLGGSVAWGFGASTNDQIPSYQIERILKKEYSLDYNIINLAEQSYSSVEELNSFIFSFHELNPSMIIILSGINDINFEYRNRYKKFFPYEDFLNFYLWGDKLGIFRERNFFLVFFKFIYRFFKKNTKINDEYYFYKKPEKDNIALELYKMKIDFVKNYCEAKKIPIFNFLQPDLFFKKNKSNFEKKYEVFEGDEKKKFIENKLKIFENELFSSNNDTKLLKNFSLLKCFDGFSQTLYVDRSHVADEGYAIVAKKICSLINQNKEIL